MRKTVIAEAIDEMDQLTLENSDIAEEEIGEMEGELTEVLESIENDFRMVEILEAIAYDAKEGKITDEQARYARFALESMNETSSTIVATEHIGTRIIEVIVNIYNRIRVSFRKLLDYLQYMLTYFNLQSGRIRKLENAVRSTHGQFATISVGLNKYMEYGRNSDYVIDMKTYMEQYRYFTEIAGGLVESAANLTEEDLGSTIDFYKEYIFGDPEDFFKTRFLSLKRNIDKAKSKFKAKPSKSTATYAEYVSEPMLGTGTVLVRFPKENSYKLSDYGSLLDAHHYFYMSVRRKKNVDLRKIVSGSIKLDVSKKDVEEIVKLSEGLLTKADNLLKMSVAFSHLFAMTEANIHRHIDNERAPNIRDSIRGMRIYLRICSIIYDTVSTGYSISLGNIKQSLSICEKAVARF